LSDAGPETEADEVMFRRGKQQKHVYANQISLFVRLTRGSAKSLFTRFDLFTRRVCQTETIAGCCCWWSRRGNRRGSESIPSGVHWSTTGFSHRTASCF